LIEETGEKDEKGEFLHDNLPGYEYVNITYDTYRYIRKTPSSAAEKVKSGQKTCRFAQGKAITPQPTQKSWLLHSEVADLAGLCY
jgi:hypothetical protein